MSQDSRIAIVGIGGLFPGAPTLAAFWDLIERGASAARPAPPGRWLLDGDQVHDPVGPAPDRVTSRIACFVEGFQLDPDGLALDRTTLARLDPMVHFALHAARAAWRDARTVAVDPRKVGVVLASIALPTDASSALADETCAAALGSRGAGPATDRRNQHVCGLVGGLVARALGLGHGSLTLDAACASSLYALKLAADELRAGRADAMLAGGLSRPDSLYTQMGFAQLRALSPSGRCAPFDTRGDGLVVGEGCGMVVLKRLDDALAHGDRIYAVIAGIGLSNDVGGSLMSPDSEGQVRAMREAYRIAGWAPTDVDLIECHGTGTPIGDAVEVASLRAIRGEASGPRRCVIGSVKSNVGHLLTGAGAAGLIKSLLALQHGVLPPTAHFTAANPSMGLDDGPLEVLSRARPWEPRAPGAPRRFAVSGFGFGGINGHVLLEEWLGAAPAPAAAPAAAPRSPAPALAITALAAQVGPWSTTEAFQHRVLGGGATPATIDAGAGWGLPVALPAWPIREVPVHGARWRIPPREVEDMLPQQALMLEVAARAWDEAGGDAADLLRTGVYVGVELDPNTTNFHLRWSMHTRAQRRLPAAPPQTLSSWVAQLRDAVHPPLTANRTMGALGGLAASRIARAFRIGGPSFTLSGLESSGLRALEAAARALQLGEIDQAVVGAVDLAADPRMALALREQGRADVVSDGAVAFVLQRLDDARREGRKILAVIRGIGAAGGSDATERALRAAHQDAAIPPSRASYVECTGAGPRDERDRESDGIRAVYGREAVAVGATVPVVGHAGAAAGLTSLARACLALTHEILPDGEPRYWLRDRADGPRVAAVSCSSGDGSHLAVLLEGCEAAGKFADRSPLGPARESLFLIEGDDEAAVLAGARDLRERAHHHGDAPLHPLAQSWWREHPVDPARALGLAVVARDAAELRHLLAPWQHGVPEQGDGARVFFTRRPLGRAEPQARVAFVFPGSGNHFAGMGRELFANQTQIPQFQDAENLRLASQFAGGLFWKPGLDERVAFDHQALIFSQVTLGTMMSDLVRCLGVKPDAVIGYSLGETAGLFSMRAWTDRDEMFARMKATTLFTEWLGGPCRAARETWGLAPDAPIDWSLGVVDRPADAVRTAIAGRERVYLLIVNTPGECVIGGDARAVEALVDAMACAFLPLQGVTTVHCEVARVVEKAYRDLHLFPTRAPEHVTFYSGILGRSYPLTRDGAADSILGQALRTLDYTRVIRQAWEDGQRVFLEMGPGASCTRMIGKILEGRPHLARSVCAPNLDGVGSLLRLTAQLISERIPVDPAPLFDSESDAPRVDDAPVVRLAVGLRPPAALPPPPMLERPPSPRVVEEAREAPTPSAAVPTVAPATPVRSVRFPTAASGWEGAPLATLVTEIAEAQSARHAAHEEFLKLSQAAGDGVARALATQLQLLEGIAGGTTSNALAAPAAPSPTPDAEAFVAPAPVPAWTADAPPRALDRAQCLEFAVGSIGRVLGPRYAEVDSHPTRVRLPDTPLMLVDRITAIDGEPMSMTSGRVVTEHDVLPGDWYLDAGRIPTCIAVESGQADLFLSGFLGIDRITKGIAVYRLLDAVVTFHDALPGPGKTIVYDIRIDGFFQQGGTYLFRFRFEGTVDGRPLLTMRDGCAGFFTPQQLAEGKGIVHTALDLRPLPGKRPSDWRELAPLGDAVEAYDDAQVEALRRGDLEAAFGAAFHGRHLAGPLRLPAGRMTLVHRILSLDPRGGRYGLGQIRGEADIHPDDWFLTCHFVDDRVMPGTLMYECCLHTFRVYLLRLGWIAETPGCGFEPVPGSPGVLKCRGQVTESTQKVVYQVSIKEIGYGPEPYAIADALMFADGRAVVEMLNLSLRIAGVTRGDVEGIWQRTTAASPVAPATAKPALFGPERILAFSIGKPSEAFGDRYRVFDQDRVIARLPGPPYLFQDRVVRIEGCEPWRLSAGGEIDAEYDVPVDAWYFASNRQPAMSFAVLLEIALQPCGWLAGYLGSALTSETDLSFRNLGGKATQLRAVTPATGTLTTTVKMTRVSTSGGMIIQNYDLCVRDRVGVVYQGDTYFGFFSKQALANQVGVRDAVRYAPSEAESARAQAFPFPDQAPFPDERLRMVGEVDCCVDDGGPQGLGYVRGTLDVDPAAWFFRAHFYQDPVVPGSLGLESMLQLLKVLAHRRWGCGEFEGVALGRPHRWSYRGQVLPTDHRVTVDAVVTAVDAATRTLTADGFLSVDGRVIYQMNDFTIRGC